MTGAAPSAVAEPRRLSRRGVMKLAGLAIGTVLLGAHTPYGQWTVYRQRNLFIVASRTDPDALALAHALADGLAAELPTSHARMTRATDAVRIASLLATGQLDVAIVSRVDAAGMLIGAGEFRAVGSVPLRRLADLGTHLVVALESFRDKHAYLLAGAVDHLRPLLPIVDAGQPPQVLPEHAGARAYRTGLPLPIDPDESDRRNEAAEQATAPLDLGGAENPPR